MAGRRLGGDLLIGHVLHIGQKLVSWSRTGQLGAAVFFVCRGAGLVENRRNGSVDSGVPRIAGGPCLDYSLSRSVVLEIPRIRAAFDLLLLTPAKTFSI